MLVVPFWRQIGISSSDAIFLFTSASGVLLASGLKRAILLKSSQHFSKYYSITLKVTTTMFAETLEAL
jgi:hypothetical protein